MEYKERRLQVGDSVVKQDGCREPNGFDQWGRGTGVGEIVEIFEESGSYCDVRWPSGRCYENFDQIQAAQEKTTS